MFTEDECLPISALQHYVFCRRQCALIHIENVWDENRLTAEGQILHEKVHSQDAESRGDIRIVRALRLRSIRLGLIGIADVVEFQKQSPEEVVDSTGSFGEIKGSPGLWKATPIEYKRGKQKSDHCDEVQLCAQAICLEEMLGFSILEGFIFYGAVRRRHCVDLLTALRDETETVCRDLHEFLSRRMTPRAVYEKKCDSCSLLNLCMPESAGGGKSVSRYMARILDEDV